MTTKRVKLLTDSPDERESPASESSHSSWYQSDLSLGPSEGPDCTSTHFYVSSNSKFFITLTFSVAIEYRESFDVLRFY